jgi:hypothetical protein
VPHNISDQPVFVQDQATIVATTILAVVRTALRDPALRNKIAALVRDEFHDVAEQAVADFRQANELTDDDQLLLTFEQKASRQ